MAGNFLTEVDGFTPVIDVVAAEVGLIPAAVYGVVWRYCQMQNGVCYASLETMGKKLGVNPATVQRHIVALCSAGFLEDTTPGLRNKPHTYRDTGRVQIRGLVEARIAERNVEPEPSPRCTPQPDIAESNVTLHTATSHCREYVEETNKIPVREHEENRIADAGASAEPPPKRERTDEQRAHDATQTAAREHFERKTGLTMPTGGNRKGIAALWWNPIREICGLVEWDTGRAMALIDAALLRLEGLTVSDPHSLLKTARSLVAEKKRSPGVQRDEYGGIIMPMSRG